MVLTMETQSEKDTFLIGKAIAEQARKGDVFLLHGDLGVGKTVFSKGFGAGLGVVEPITSPTYTILQEYYDGNLPLFHFDVYRISDSSEMDEIGYEDYFYGDGVCLIEWASRIEDILPMEAIQITVEKDLEKGFDYRKIIILSQDEREWVFE